MAGADFDESTIPGGIEDLPSAVSETSPRSYLLVFEGTGSSIFYLPPSGEVVIGRGEGAKLQLQHTATSRRHACLRSTAEGAILSDLGSHNGTLVNGERIRTPRRLLSGDVVNVSYATLVFHQAGQRLAARAALDLDAFRQRIEEEVERALRYERPLALLMVNLEAGPDRAAVVLEMGKLLRRIDVMAWASSNQLLVLLPEHDGVAARSAAVRLRFSLRNARIGVAAFPAEAADADGLVAAARAAAMGAAPAPVLSAAEAASTVDLGDRAGVVAEPAMVQLYELLRKLAATALPVLVCGETGVGKENAALALHRFSPRRDRRLVTINCAALPESLVESELFGHSAGAFTGATAHKMGLLESGHGGTVFLDEVGELTLATQAKLLRVLETKRLQRLGEVTEREADVRLVAATNRYLKAEVQAGRFRQDLYFRVGATMVLIPPLRDRKRDLPLLARRFLDDARAAAKLEPMALSPATMQRLFAHDWPGNVRELKNAMEYAAAMSLGSVVEPSMLPGALGDPGAARLDSPTSPLTLPEARGQQFRSIADEVRELEQRRMSEALAAADGVQKRAAELIDMPLRTFIVKLEQYGLKAPPKPRSPRE
jgi:DNA-binding NtrC family response regulator